MLLSINPPSCRCHATPRCAVTTPTQIKAVHTPQRNRALSLSLSNPPPTKPQGSHFSQKISSTFIKRTEGKRAAALSCELTRGMVVGFRSALLRPPGGVSPTTECRAAALCCCCCRRAWVPDGVVVSNSAGARDRGEVQGSGERMSSNWSTRGGGG